MWIQVIESPLGDLTAYWSELGISRLTFGRQEEFDAEVAGSGAESGPRALVSCLAEYFDGGELEFPLAHLDWTGTPDFHRRVLQRCAQIGRGQTMTYGGLAAATGSPAAARAVGQVMARNRWPLIIPCHRVVGHSGRLTGYSGIGGVDTKRLLLDFEGGGSLLALNGNSGDAALTALAAAVGSRQ
jgi:methylated-DNA-[protein]-cysteine S-methyltransferase